MKITNIKQILRLKLQLLLWLVSSETIAIADRHEC